MNFISTPLKYQNDVNNQNGINIKRDISDQIKSIDNLVELIVFTPRGSFAADADFGFEYWNHEYSNVHSDSFNTGQNGELMNGLYSEITRRECQESIKAGLATYEPRLKDVETSIELQSTDMESGGLSKFKVIVNVSGKLECGLDIHPYNKEIEFMVEPTAKQVRKWTRI